MPIARSSVANVVTTATLFSTAFSATENPIASCLHGGADGLDWFDNQSVAGKAYATNIDHDGVTDNVSQLRRTVLACTSNQFSRLKIFKNVGYGTGVNTHELEAFVNVTIGPHSIVGYESYLNFLGNHTLVRWDGPHNTYTPLASNNAGNGSMPAYADGDEIMIERVGATLNCYHKASGGSFVLYTTFSDSTYLGGNPGFGTNPADDTGGSPVVSSAGFTAWVCGNL